MTEGQDIRAEVEAWNKKEREKHEAWERAFEKRQKQNNRLTWVAYWSQVVMWAVAILWSFHSCASQ